MRRLPENIRELAEAVEVSLLQNHVTQTRHYKLITPLLGGGIKPKEADPIKCVSEKGIRGQLRFWWRACRGASALTNQQDILRDMKQRENEIWGAASTPSTPMPSQVALVVEEARRGVEITKTDRRVPKYAAFPLENYDTLLDEVEFTLRITFPANKREDVEAALWCWETFGGIGGRTRRGFGAFELMEVKENGVDVVVEKWNAGEAEEKIRNKISAIRRAGTWADGVPHISTSSTFLVTNSEDEEDRNLRASKAVKSWRHLINGLQRFRQSPRTATQYRGRSHWPEPDEIRRQYTTRTGRTTARTPIHPVRKFPRAEFGLPIIFKFKDEDEGDPNKTTLEGRDHKRLASPLILRPIACANNEAVGLALILDTPRTPPGGVELKDYGPVRTDLDATGATPEATHIVPMNQMPLESDVLKAFLRTL